MQYTIRADVYADKVQGSPLQLFLKYYIHMWSRAWCFNGEYLYMFQTNFSSNLVLARLDFSAAKGMTTTYQTSKFQFKHGTSKITFLQNQPVINFEYNIQWIGTNTILFFIYKKYTKPSWDI